MASHDEDSGADSEAMDAILSLLDGKAGEMMREKHGPKPEAAKDMASGHVVTVTVTPHVGKHEEPDGDELSPEMLKGLLGDGD